MKILSILPHCQLLKRSWQIFSKNQSIKFTKQGWIVPYKMMKTNDDVRNDDRIIIIFCDRLCSASTVVDWTGGGLLKKSLECFVTVPCCSSLMVFQYRHINVKMTVYLINYEIIMLYLSSCRCYFSGAT